MTTDAQSKPRAAWLTALLVPLLAFFALPPLSRSGLWDPYELGAADVARRIALHVLHGGFLAIDPSRDAMPTLAEVGRPPLPLTIVAAGFRIFGLHDWAGRAPLALVGVIGVGCTYLSVARLIDRRAGVYAAVALTAMPLYFVGARTILGDVVTMSASAAAFGGLAVAVFDASSRPARGAFLAVALGGLLLGFGSRGAILGVAVPCMGVGAAWLLGVANGRQRAERLGDVIAIGALLVGFAALVAGWHAVATTPTGEVSQVAGVLVHAPGHAPPFDRVIAHVGHALLPWSAFVPFAIGRLFVAPACGEDAVDRESHARVVVLAGASCALAAHAFLAAHADLVPFSAPALVAVGCAIAIRDFERGAAPSVAVAVGTLLLAAVFQHDLRALPEKAFEPFGVAASSFPADFHARAGALWSIAIAIFAAFIALAWVDDDRPRVPFDRARYESIARSLRTAWDGRVAVAYVACVAAAVALSATILVGLRMHARFALAMPALLRPALLNAWWVVACAPLVVIFGAALALDVASWVVARVPIFNGKRAALAIVGAAAAGLVLCAGYYPALAAELSPKSVFAKYERTHAEGEPLALLDVSDRGAAYYTGAKAPAFHDPASALAWLDAPSQGRRFLAAARDDLPRLNALHRASAHANLAVLEVSDRSILAVTQLLAGEPSANPLDAFVVAAAPSTRHPLDVNLNDRVTVLGVDLVDPQGKRIDAITTGRHPHLRTYYRVLAPLGTDYTLFVHIEGFGRRNNGDHPFPYATSLWQAGDIVVDDHEIVLEPNFTPGVYQLYFGLYSGGSDGPRLPMKGGGEGGDNRVHGGAVRVE